MKNKIKVCTRCGLLKSLDCFSVRNKKSLTKRASWCKVCISSWHKEYIKKEGISKKRSEYSRRWRDENVSRYRELAMKVVGCGKIQCLFYKTLKCCNGQSDLRFLQIDHIEGNGKKHRLSKSNNGLGFYMWIVKNKNEAQKDLQLLCANANWIKRCQNKEYHHGI